MIYFDYGATSFYKPPQVYEAVAEALQTCASPGRGGYWAAREGEERVYACREAAGELFHCQPHQVVMTASGTQGLNMAIHALFSPGDRVVISGFEHNAVTRPLHGWGIRAQVAGRRLFDWEDTLAQFRKALETRPDGAVFTHVSNVFGYILPIEEMAELCRDRGIPFIIDAAQSAGALPLNFEALGADYIAMPGHKGLLGPQGTGLLLCRRPGRPFLLGGTGSISRDQEMPDFLPDALEAGTLNVPGIAGLEAGLRYVLERGPKTIGAREHGALLETGRALERMGFRVFMGEHQAGTLSFLTGMDCQEAADLLARQGIALRAGLHCAPLAHESGGTAETGTLRLSFGWREDSSDRRDFLRAVSKLPRP